MLERFYHLLKISDQYPQKCDFIVVLSYALKSKNELTPMTKACCDIAVSLWKKHQSAYVIMSTGDNQHLNIPNSKVMIDYALSRGVPKSKLISEDKSKNTYENLMFSKKMIELAAGSSNPAIVAVAYDLHMRRALKTARKVGIKISGWISAYSISGKAYGYKGWLQTRSRDTMFVYDVLAISYSKIRGWI